MPELALTRSLTAALGGLLVLPATTLAANGESTPLNLDAAKQTAAEHAAGSGASAIVRTIVGLLVVLVVIYGVAWVLKQVKSSKEGKASGGGLQPIATLPLGSNRSLHLVRAGNEYVLVGAGEHGVVPVRTYTEAEARELGLLDDGGDDTPGGLLNAPARRRSWLDELRAKTVIK